MMDFLREEDEIYILERQREGMAIAKRDGKYQGRRKIKNPEEWDLLYEKYKVGEITAKYAYTKMEISKSTFFRMKKEYESKIKSD